MENKSILIFERDIKTSSEILPEVMSGGYGALHIRELEKVMKLLESGKFNIFICDADDDRSLDLLEKIKNRPDVKMVHVIMVTKSKEKNNLVRMLEKGACGIIIRPFDAKSFFEKMKGYIQRVEDKFAAKRQHLRVEPFPWDKAQAEYRHPKTLSLFTGPILNISMGGFLVDFKQEQFPFVVKEKLENIRVSMLEYRFQCHAQIVAIKGSMVALQITDMNKAAKLSLGKYVFKTINRLPDAEQ